jgi:methionyl-tRNA formyltransferase
MLKIWEAEPVAGSGLPGEILGADRHGIVVACGEGALRVLVLQREGGRRVAAGEFLAGCPIAPGQRLG